MQDWFFYALLSGVFAGLYSFFLKVSAEKNHSSFLVTAYSMFFSSFISLVLFLFSSEEFKVSWILICNAIINSIFYFIAVTTRVESLKNIDTTIYFPLYKTLGPILMAFVGVFIFSDKLDGGELFGIALGIAIPLLLIHKGENKKQSNLQKGLIYLVVGTIFAVMSSATAKVVNIYQLNLFLHIFISFLSGGLLSLYLYQKKHKKSAEHSNHKLKRVGVLNGALLFLSMYFFNKSAAGDLSIVYTINSFSILVPIMLAVFVYREHFNWKKGTAIVLTLVSLMFLR